MRIQNAYTTIPDEVTAAAARKAAPHGAHGEDAPGGAAAGDAVTVNLSARAQELAAKPGQGVDDAKVARLKAAVKDGTLNVDPDAIAAKLVNGG